MRKLPGGLQKPVLNELGPIRNIFLQGRAARLALLGEESFEIETLLSRLAGEAGQRGPTVGGWTEWTRSGQREISVADLRTLTVEQTTERMLASPPDQFLLILNGDLEPGALQGRLAHAGDVIHSLAKAGGGPTSLLVLVDGSGREVATVARAIDADPLLSAVKGHVVALAHGEAAANAASELLPEEAQLEFVRFMGARKGQARIARSLLASFAGVCGVIGLQPIPLADMPVLVTLQTLMVSLIIYTSGRTLRPRVIAEFLGALGFNVGAGYAFREGARALVKVLPFWGNAISGFVAGAGTYAIGRSAIAYFIDRLPPKEARQLYRSLKPKRFTFRRKALPPPLPPPDHPGETDGARD